MTSRERVARAMKKRAAEPLYNLHSLNNVLVGSLGDAWPYLADAAIAAYEAALADEGMVIVPREATEGMIEAAVSPRSAVYDPAAAAFRSGWRAMIAAWLAESTPPTESSQNPTQDQNG